LIKHDETNWSFLQLSFYRLVITAIDRFQYKHKTKYMADKSPKFLSLDVPAPGSAGICGLPEGSVGNREQNYKRASARRADLATDPVPVRNRTRSAAS
jgi:hypothetical protein